MRIQNIAAWGVAVTAAAALAGYQKASAQGAALVSPVGVQFQTPEARWTGATSASSREAELRASLQARPTLNGYFELVRLQEARGATRDAEATLIEARTVLPSERAILIALAAFYDRTSRFDLAVQTTDQLWLESSDVVAQFVVATFYEERVRRNTTLTPDGRGKYVRAGMSAVDHILSTNPDWSEALTLRRKLLRY